MNTNNNKPQQVNMSKKKVCYFSTNNVCYIDYKDIELLKKFTSYYGKIEPSSKTGVKRKFQNRLATAIKRARYMAMLPYYVQ